MSVLFGRSFAGTCKPVFFCMMEQSHCFQLPPWRLRSISITVCFPNAWADGSEENRESRRRSSAGGRYRRSLCVFFAEKGIPKWGDPKSGQGANCIPKSPAQANLPAPAFRRAQKYTNAIIAQPNSFFQWALPIFRQNFKRKISDSSPK